MSAIQIDHFLGKDAGEEKIGRAENFKQFFHKAISHNTVCRSSI